MSGNIKRAAVLSLAVIFLISAPYSYSNANASGMNRLNGVCYDNSAQNDRVVVYLENPPEFNVLALKDPYRIVIDVENTLTYIPYHEINVLSSLIDKVRFSQFNPGTARIVIVLKGAYDFKVDTQSSKMSVHVYPRAGSRFTTESADEQQQDSNNDNDPGGAAQNPGSGTASRGDLDRKKSYTPVVQYVRSTAEDRLSIRMEGHSGVKVMRLTDPDRVVVYFEGVSLLSDADEVKVGGSYVDMVRYDAFDSNTVRVVADLTGQHNFSYMEQNGMLTLSVKKASYRNIRYYNTGDRIYLELDGIELTKGRDENLQLSYDKWFDSTGKNLSISFPSSLGHLASGEMFINDWFINSISVMRGSARTIVTFNAKEKLKYVIRGRSAVNNTAVTVLPVKSKADRMVVIDPGHGGTEEPGAVYGGIYEKDLNLDIAMRLDKLLESKGVNTFMIREDDSFVGLYERAEIANDLNAALFLSIHCNAMTIKSIKGTETICFSRSSGPGFTGYDFARIVQRHVLDALGTFDRGVYPCPDLIVLKATSMPSALVEIAFMSNTDDLRLLKQPSFRQKAAQALSDAVIEALD